MGGRKDFGSHHFLNPERLPIQGKYVVIRKGLFCPEGEDSVHNFKGETSVSDGSREAGLCVFPGKMCNGGHVPLLRLERLWQEELNEVGPDAASLRRVVWTFCRTRLILSIVCLMITQLAGFSGPVSPNHPF